MAWPQIFFAMKLLTVKRRTQTENRFSPSMGRLVTKVTYIRKYFLGMPIKIVHRYRETYYGEVKSCDDCRLTA